MSSSTLLQWTKADRTAILQTFGVTEACIAQSVQSIKEWMAREAHLPEVADDAVIERFFVRNKCRVEKTKEKIDAYYSARSILPEIYDNNPNDLEYHKIRDAMCVMPLPKLTKELNRVTIVKLLNPDATDFDACHYLAYTFHVAEVRFREDYLLSEVYINDLGGTTLNHLLMFTPAIIKKATFLIEKVYTRRAFEIHFINAPGFMNKASSLMKRVLHPKLAERINVHSDLESLYKMVPKEILPKDYGGDEKSIAELQDEWNKKFLAYDDVYQHLRKVKVNESLRVGEPIHSELFGVNGNFRKLEID